MAEVARYLEKIQSLYEAGMHDPSAYRQPLKALIASIAEGVTTAPVRTLAGFSSADLVVLVNGEPIGHILYEGIDVDLDRIEQDWLFEGGPPQGDLLATNFLEFRHYRDGTLVRVAQVAQARRLFQVSSRGTARVDKLLQRFVGRRAKPSIKEPPPQKPKPARSKDGKKGERVLPVGEFQFFDDLFSEEDDLPHAEAPPEPTIAADEVDGKGERRGFFSRLFSRRDDQEEPELPDEPEEEALYWGPRHAAPEGRDDELEGTLLDLSLLSPDEQAPPGESTAHPPVPDVSSPAHDATAPQSQGDAPPTAEVGLEDDLMAEQKRPSSPVDELPWWLEADAEALRTNDGAPTPAEASVGEAPQSRDRGSGPLIVSPGVRISEDEASPAMLQVRLADAQAKDNPHEVANLLSRIARDFYMQGEPNDAISHYWQALVQFRELGERREEAAILACLGIIYAEVGEREYALSQFVEALPILDQVDDPFLEGFIQGHMGIVHHEMGIDEAAAANLTEALPLVTRDEMLYGLFLGKLGETEYRLGNTQRAASLLEEALLHKQETDTQRVRFLSALGTARYRLGQYRAAAGTLKDAIHLVQQSDRHDEEGRLWGRLGAAMHMAGEFEKADDAHRKALAIHRALGDTKREAAALYNLAGACEARQEPDRAADLFEQAAALYDTLGDAKHAASARQGVKRIRRSAEAESAAVSQS